MLQFLMCLFCFHGATEIEYTDDDKEIKVCRNCLKEVKWLLIKPNGGYVKQIITFICINHLLGYLYIKTSK